MVLQPAHEYAGVVPRISGICRWPVDAVIADADDPYFPERESHAIGIWSIDHAAGTDHGGRSLAAYYVTS